MTTPSNAAKAASILHHTWGVEDCKAAVAIYDLLDAADEAEFDAYIDNAEGWGVYEAYEQMNSALIWENIHSLACSVDACIEELS